MKASPDCLPCILRQVLRVARKSTDDSWLHRKLLNEVMVQLAHEELNETPAELVYSAIHRACRTLGVPDPMKEEREQLTHRMLEQREKLIELRDGGEDILYRSLLLAAAGNAVDAAIFRTVEPLAEATRAFEKGFAIDDYAEFKEDLDEAEKLLYVLDNAGEVLVDRLLIEQFKGIEVTVVVQKGPILHDAIAEDIEAIDGLDGVRIIDSGYAGLGLPLASCGKDLRDAFDEADLILAKGSASYETLEGEGGTKYFLLHTKCDVVSRHFGVDIGAFIFMKD